MKPLKLSGTPASVLVQLTPSTAGSLGSPTQDAHCRISASPLPFPFLKNSGAPTPPPASGTTPVTRRAAALAEAVTEAMTEADGTLPTSGGRANAQVVRAPAPQHLPPPALVPRSRFAARSSTAQNDKVGRVGAWGGGVSELAESVPHAGERAVCLGNSAAAQRLLQTFFSLTTTPGLSPPLTTRPPPPPSPSPPASAGRPPLKCGGPCIWRRACRTP